MKDELVGEHMWAKLIKWDSVGGWLLVLETDVWNDVLEEELA